MATTSSPQEGAKGNGKSEDNHDAQPTAFSQVGKNVKLDHLGIPMKARTTNKFRYARTYTILYGTQKQRSIAAEKQYALLQDTRKVMDCSLAGLRRLFAIFNDASKSLEESMVGPREFRLALERHGLRDLVMVKRLFTDFYTEESPRRLDYRNFLRVIATVNEEPIEDKIALLFDVWDVDASKTLTHNELAPNVFADLATNEMASMAEQFSKVWNEIRNNLSEDGDGDHWIGLSRASGVTKEDLLDAVRKLPNVQLFFSKMLTRQPPKADERRPQSFEARLAELRAEILEETRAAADRLQRKASQNASQTSLDVIVPPPDVEAAKDAPQSSLSGIGSSPRAKSLPQLGASKSTLDAYKAATTATMQRQTIGGYEQTGTSKVVTRRASLKPALPSRRLSRMPLLNSGAGPRV